MRAIRLLQLTTFVSTLDRFVMPPMLISIAGDLDAPLSEVVRAASVYFLVYGLMQLVWGTVSDSLGLVRTMRLTMLAAAVSTITAAFVLSPLWLAVTRGLAGGFFGAAYPASLVYLGDTVPARERQPEIARLMVGTAMGIGLASVGAGLVAQLLSWRAAFVVTGVASLVLTVLLRQLAQPPMTRRGSSVVKAVAAVGRTKAAVFVLLMAFTEGVVLLGVLTLLPPAVEQSGTTPAVAGAVTAVYGLAVFLMTRVVVRLTKRFHPAIFIGAGAIAAVVACALLAVGQDPVITAIAAVLLGLAWTSMHSSLQTWATEVVPGARATMISLFATALFAGSAVAAAAVAGLAEDGAYGTIFFIAAVLTVPLGLFGSVSRARWREP
ncbi:MFS transporter [Kibdelosporangium phytohabitans]|uniref:MFS transporter n=1 Tax=Kibdelosporangium phytohabitans TaxID=860235 RepID=A0A0N7F3K5_9PSEU|nr:MFS transporter [Kibdelosporangium phytohabitans]ALG08887.1 MFS transporter [Kibdelosporangium phytohabitans]MBE1469960.1 MFS family permease [Kibdelosporangium phytohabitans]